MMKLVQKLPWTLSFVLEWWPYLSLRSIIRLRDYEIRNERGDAIPDRVLTLDMRSPINGEVSFREFRYDILTFNEILHEQAYRVVLPHVKERRWASEMGARKRITNV